MKLLRIGGIKMQTLKFESSWHKALSNQDRKTIEAAFLETSKFNNTCIQFTPLWQASNHKGELLVTVLIHNFKLHPFSFYKTMIGYTEHSQILAEYAFTIPSLDIAPETTMPWTFIYPIESIKDIPTFQNGHLTLIE